MEKMRMESLDMTAQNIEKIGALFPNCITETKDASGKPKKAINFDLLRQMLSADVIEGNEAYEFTWVGKKAAIVEANKPIRKTLRPCKEESVNWDSTENLYIEGDNLEVLKLLQESYLGKVKMIYIDPPYNTGNDFIYRDDFKQSAADYEEDSGVYDEDGNRMFKNTDTNGRFHSDWCSMIYSRLMLARNLLTDDGVIFISIDDNENDNLAKICDEVFGIENRIGPIIQNKQNAKNDTVNIQKNHEFVLIYRKTKLTDGTKVKPSLVRFVTVYRDIIEDNGRFYYLNDPITTRGEGGTLNARPNLGYTVYYNPQTGDICAISDYDNELAKSSNEEDLVYSTDDKLIANGYVAIRPPRVRGKLGCWTWAIDKFNAEKDNIVITGKNGNYAVRKRTFVEASSVQLKDGRLVYASTTTANSRSILDFSTNEGTNTLNSLIQGNLFNNPKNLDMIEYFMQLVRDPEMVILDFFSGSATTAHAVMQLNAEDGGNRKFIMVQLPEPCDEKSEAYKAGYANICEIGKERIRRAGQKILAELAEKETAAKEATLFDDTSNTPPTLDVGFRVLKLDDTNMKDVYYAPADYEQGSLDEWESNIKEDRSDLDLLFGCLLEWGLPLSLPYKSEEIAGCTVHNYNDGDLVACFDENIPDRVIKTIAKRQPLRAVFRDSSFADSPAKINVTQIFKELAPDTSVKVL